MTIAMSSVVPTRRHRPPGFVDLQQLDLPALGGAGSPLVMVDDFRVAGLPFPPHPHAGFAAVTYVFDDATTGLRSRSSTGEDLVVGPGGIVWSEAGSGLLHEESSVDVGGELHGVQLFVNLSAANELTTPRMLALDAHDVPVWRDDDNRVRVVVGAHDEVRSPLAPVEPFTLLDVELHRELVLEVAKAHHMVIYVRSGSLAVRLDERRAQLTGGTSIALHGDPEADGRVTLVADEPSRVLVLSGRRIDEPVVVEGSFIMSDRGRISDALSRYRTGAMGSLAASTPSR